IVTTTIRDYVLSEVSKLVHYIGIAVMAFLHGYMEFTQPLLIQPLMGLKGLYDTQPVLIHILGQKAEVALKGTVEGWW
ncbi:hypothetical protein K435DRAFT_682122, partial [Dendrothele bispora CBS 962.96]